MATQLKQRKKIITEDSKTSDSFHNFTAKLGLQTENLSAAATYNVGSLISRNHVILENMYRTSWIVGQAVDTVAEDMTKEGIEMFSKMSPDNIQKLQSMITELAIWRSLCSTVKWARLYGGAIAVMLIDKADYSTPLDVSKVGKNSFKGLAVFDRWQIQPSLGELVTELCPEMGMPKYYDIIPGIETMPNQRIHYSRLVRLDGIEMPYYQKKYDNLWGMSVVERFYDRLLAFDSATTGAAQLLYKAYLRVIQVKGLRTALAMGGKTEQAVIKQFEYIRLMQSIEGITLLDSEDQFSAHNYSFSGVSDVLIQFGQQISGSLNIPLVRLFGQSPSGFSTGDADLRNYYDSIHKDQESKLRTPMYKILDVMSMSKFGQPLPEDFEFNFISLWQPSDLEKSQIATSDMQTINTAFQSGIIIKKIAMKELAQQSHATGRFTNITDEDIEAAKEEPPEHQGLGLGKGEEEKPVEPKPDHKLDLESLKQELANIGKPKADSEENSQSLSELENEVNNIGIESPLETELDELQDDDKSMSDLEDELAKLSPDTLSQIEKEVLAVKAGSKTIYDLQQELSTIGLSNVLLKKMSTDQESVNKRGNSFVDAVKKFFGVKDESLRAPKGGIALKGKEFVGGQFIPSEGGYQEEYKKIKSGELKEKKEKIDARLTEISENKKVNKEKLKELSVKLKSPDLGMNQQFPIKEKPMTFVIKEKKPEDKENVNKIMKMLQIKEEDIKDITNVMTNFESATVSVNSWDDVNLHIENKYKVKVGGESKTAEFNFSLYPEKKECHIDMVDLPKAEQGKNTGKAFLQKVEETMKRKGIHNLSLCADLSVGGYAWARMGFDFKDKADFETAKNSITKLLKQKNIKMSNEEQKKFDELKTAKDISEFVVKGAEFTGKEWKLSLHKDIPKDMKMHIGKAVLLGEVNFYDAVKGV